MMLHVEDAFNVEKIGRKKPVVVQIPKLNFTLSNEYFSQLYLVSKLSEAFKHTLNVAAI